MKRILLLFLLAVAIVTTSGAQGLIYDNGPFVNSPGAGAGGADVSELHSGLTSYGSGHAPIPGFRTADDFTVPPGENWIIDSIVVYDYQTNSFNNNISTITSINVRIWDGNPGGSTVVFGDTSTNRIGTTAWSGAYRTAWVGHTICPPDTCTARPLMRTTAYIGTTLGPGTYWLDWQVGGTLASGPFTPHITLGPGVTNTGNGQIFTPSTSAWTNIVDQGLMTETQGLPFLIIGSIFTGIGEITGTQAVTVSPNPFSEYTDINIRTGLAENSIYAFRLYDVLGNVVREQNISDSKFRIGRESLTNGIYFYELTQNGSTVNMGKMVLQ